MEGLGQTCGRAQGLCRSPVSRLVRVEIPSPRLKEGGEKAKGAAEATSGISGVLPLMPVVAVALCREIAIASDEVGLRPIGQPVTVDKLCNGLRTGRSKDVFVPTEETTNVESVAGEMAPVVALGL